MHFPAFQEYAAGIRLRDAADALHDLRAARAHEACEAEDLTGMNRKGYVAVEAGPGQPLHFKDRGTDLHFRLREEIRDFTADHGLDQVGICNAVHVISSDIAGIAEYRHSGGQAVHQSGGK